MTYKLDETPYEVFMKKVKRDFKTYHHFRPGLNKSFAKEIWEASAERIFIAFAKDDKNIDSVMLLS